MHEPVPPTVPKRKNLLWSILLGIGLVLLVAAFVLPFFLANFATTPSQQAPDVVGTLNANITPTVTPIPLPESPRDLYAYVTGKQPTSSSRMTPGDSWDWELSQNKEDNNCHTTLGYYVPRAVEPNSTQHCLARKTNMLGNFAVQIKTTLSNGKDTDGGGVYLQGKNGNVAYRIQIDFRKTYEVSDTFNQLLMTGTSEAIKTDVSTTFITFIVRDHTLYLYLGGEFMGKALIDSDTYQVGVFARHSTKSLLTALLFEEMRYWAL